MKPGSVDRERLRLPLLAVAQSGLEVASAQGKDVRADLDGLFVGGEGAGGGVLLLRSTSPALGEGLHPECFGGVGYGFGNAVQGGRTCIQARGESLPPGIQQRIDRVRGASTELIGDLFDRGAFAGGQQGAGCLFDVSDRDAARGLAIAVRSRGGHFRTVSINTLNI